MVLYRPFAAIFEPLMKGLVCLRYHTAFNTRSGRTQRFLDCTAREDAFLAGGEVCLVGTQAVEITKGTTRD